MGIMDLERLDKTLTGIMENKGLAITGVVQRLAQENLNNLIQTSQRDRDDSNTFVPLTDEAFSPQKILMTTLINIGREIDLKWKADLLSEENLKEIANRENLWLVAVLNKRGKMVFQSRPLPQDFFRIPKREKITIDLFTRFGKLKKMGFIAIKRRDGSGTIIIALDKNGYRHWYTKISVQRAIEEMGWDEKLAFITVMNRRDKLLGSAGEIPEKWKEGNINVSEMFSGKRNFVSREVTLNDKNYLEIIAPLYLNGEVAGIARLGLKRDSMVKILKDNRVHMFIFMFFMVLITLLSMWLLYHNQNRHLARMEEMGKQLQKAERLSALGQLAAGVAHEIRNPLNALSMANQRLKREYIPDDTEKGKELQTLTNVIRDEINRLNGIIEEFLTFSRNRRLKLQNFPIVEILQKIINLAGEEIQSRGITIKTDWSNNHTMFPMDVNKMQQAFLNLFKNAMESISGSGTIAISVEADGTDRIIIKISDTGSGMSPEEMEQIFNLEYTTKEKGLGLGLPLAHEIIHNHGGGIRVKSEPGSGSTFEVLLPVKKAE
jgi:signal transduction histidine kinase